MISYSLNGSRVSHSLLMAMNTIEDTLHDLKALFNNAPDLAGTIRKYIDENAGLKKQVEEDVYKRQYPGYPHQDSRPSA